jgi:hypothetical protein
VQKFSTGDWYFLSCASSTLAAHVHAAEFGVSVAKLLQVRGIWLVECACLKTLDELQHYYCVKSPENALIGLSKSCELTW